MNEHQSQLDDEDDENRPVYDISSVQQRLYDPRDEEFV